VLIDDRCLTEVSDTAARLDNNEIPFEETLCCPISGLDRAFRYIFKVPCSIEENVGRSEDKNVVCARWIVPPDS
jgi:hypothetical protein